MPFAEGSARRIDIQLAGRVLSVEIKLIAQNMFEVPPLLVRGF